MYYVLYNNISGNLVDIAESEFAPERFDGQLTLTSGTGALPDLARVSWNPSILDFQPKPIRELSKLEFLTRFSIAERIAARTSTDPVAMDIMQMLDIAEFINLDDVNTQQSLGYLASVGIISTERAAEIQV